MCYTVQLWTVYCEWLCVTCVQLWTMYCEWLCVTRVQLWTMYCESLAALSFTVTESYVNAHQTVMDFWGRVTPGILQLLSHSKVVC